MIYTLRRFALGLITVPIAIAVYAAIYFTLFMLVGFGSFGLLMQNTYAVGFGWVVAVTFSKQVFDLIERLGK